MLDADQVNVQPMPAHSLPTLSALQARILGVLVEKERTVPDTYPLSLNALVAGCNQKTSRDPVMNATEAEVLSALDELRQRSLVIETSGGRVMRYEQNVRRVLEIPSESVALIATLALRGPQTAAELRANAERLYRFSDVSALEAFLDELRNRSAGALVVELPRQPGARENRWMHLLCGAPPASALQQPAAAGHAGPGQAIGTTSAATGDAEVQALREDVGRLQAEVAALRSELSEVRGRLDGLCRQLGADER